MRKRSEYPIWPAAPVTATRTGALGIERAPRDKGEGGFRFYSSGLLRRAAIIESLGTSGGTRDRHQPHVDCGREDTTSEVPVPVRAPVRDSHADLGLGPGHASQLGSAA